MDLLQKGYVVLGYHYYTVNTTKIQFQDMISLHKIYFNFILLTKWTLKKKPTLEAVFKIYFLPLVRSSEVSVPTKTLKAEVLLWLFSCNIHIHPVQGCSYLSCREIKLAAIIADFIHTSYTHNSSAHFRKLFRNHTITHLLSRQNKVFSSFLLENNKY